MATAADKKRWDELHAAQAEAGETLLEYEIELGAKYGRNFSSSWLSAGQRKKLESLRNKESKIGDKIVDLLVKVSPRDWMYGVPAWWVREKLTWEDAIRPKNEPLSVVVPGAYGYPDGTVREKRGMNMARKELEIQIPDMQMWEQIGGDVSPGQYGGLLARSDGGALELLEIQPVREAIGDGEAADVGFPFWTKEGYYRPEDLDPSKKDVRRALESVGLEDEDLEEMSPTQRALAIAEALMRYGIGSEEGQAGWSKDIVPDRVKWWGGTVAGPEYLADEDDDFRREVLGDEDDEEEEEEETD